MKKEKREETDMPQTVQHAKWHGFMCDAPRKQRLLIFAGLALIIIVLYYTPVGSFTAGGDVTMDNGGFIITLALLPAVIGALLLGVLPGTLLGLVMAAACMSHAGLFPANVIDFLDSSPFTTVLPMMLTLFVAGVLFASAMDHLSVDDRRSQIGHIFLISLLTAIVFCVSRRIATLLLFADASFMTASALDVLAALTEPARIIEILVCTATIMAACLPVLIAIQRKREGLWNRSMRAVFRRYLFVFMAATFILTLAVTYNYESNRARTNTIESLTHEITYLDKQIDEHNEKTAQLRAMENTIVLDEAHEAATLIAENPSMMASTSSMRALADRLGLASLTVTDGNGLVVADADGVGIGSYSFGDHEQTQRYMALTTDPSSTVTEEPRASVDASGNATDTYSLFAGVGRTDAVGIVQVSIPASDYESVLAAASIEHLADSYTIGSQGGVAIAKDSTIVTATEDWMVGTDAVSTLDLNATALEQDEASIVQLGAERTLTCVRTIIHGDYIVSAYLPLSEVYASRNSIMLWNAILYLVLFTVVFLLASRLLSTVVIDGIQETNETLGHITQGDLDKTVNVRGNSEFESLSDGINTTVDALKDSIAEASARIDRELATAKAIQSSALPSTFPPFPEISDFDIFASMNPAREVGGDFYDFFLIGEHRLGFLIADVSGKGIPAALFMMTAKTELENYMSSTEDLAEAITTVNHRLCIGNEAEMFVTAFLATLDFETGELTYVNAGHNPPLLRHDGTWEWVTDKSGLFLGGMDDLRYRSFTRMLEGGDEILLYTDGVTEAWDAGETTLYGEDRLIGLLQEHVDLHPTTLIRKVQNDIARFAEGAEQADDITMVAMEYGVAPDVSDSITIPALTDNLDKVLGFVHGELDRRLCPVKTQKQLDIAIEELFVNIAHYAYPGATEEAPGKAKVAYTYSAVPPTITIELSDKGTPYNPLKRADPEQPATADEAEIGGLGIMMAKRCVDDIDYRYEHGRNIITFSKGW